MQSTLAVVSLRYLNGNQTPQQTAKLSGWVRELILFFSSTMQRDEDAQIVRSRRDLDARSGELGTQLVKPPRRDAPLRAIDVEGRYWRMVGGLFGEVRYGDRLLRSVVRAFGDR